eukprot:6344304-Alexandrium_andersonii.AAC.1
MQFPAPLPRLPAVAPDAAWSSVEALRWRSFYSADAKLEVRAAQWLAEEGGRPVPPELEAAANRFRASCDSP